MNSKMTPLIAAIIGAAMLALQQFVGQPQVNVKVIILAVVIAIVGAVGTVLKGKGATTWGVVGTVLYTFYQNWGTADFNWTQFGVVALIAVLSLFSHSFIPEPEQPK